MEFVMFVGFEPLVEGLEATGCNILRLRSSI